jgi:hypothetical protein
MKTALQLSTAKAALSNLLGGFVYAYGPVTVTYVV